MPNSPAVVHAGNLERDPLKRSFANFQYKTWTTLFGERPSRVIYDVGEWVSAGPRKSVSMGFRGLAKSYTTVDYALWRLWCDRGLQVLSVSGEGGQAKGNAALAWSWLNNFDWLAEMRPRGELRQSAQAFDVQGTLGAKSESFAALSLFASLPGRRADLIIPDDVETPNTASTETARAELEERYKELGGAILKPGGEVKVLGTPQAEDTLYLKLALQSGYAMRIWPVIYPKEDEIVHYGPWLAPSIQGDLQKNSLLAGTPVEPTRFGDEELFGTDGRFKEYGLLGWRRQFLLWTDVGGTDEKPLRLRDCPVVDIPAPTPGVPFRVPSELRWTTASANVVQNLYVDAMTGDSEVYYPVDTKEYREWWQTPESTLLQIDPSGGGKDETAWVVLAQHCGRIFVLDMGASLEGFSVPTLQAIAKMASKWKVQRIRIEKNFGGGMFTSLLRPQLARLGHGCGIEEEFATGQKEVRIIDSLEGLVGDHRIVFNKAVLEDDFQINYDRVEDAKKRFYRLTYQFTRITREKGALAHDDRLDALASGVSYFKEALKRATEEAELMAKADFLNKEVQDYLDEQERQRESENPYGRQGPGGGPWGPSLLKNLGGMAKSALFKGRTKP